MDDNEEKRWYRLAIVGTVFMGVCLAISLFQYFSYKIDYENVFVRYAGVVINTVAFFCFVALIFLPTNFWFYVILFYVYCIGNFIDYGNMLGGACLVLAYLFLVKLHFFDKHKIPKLILFSIPPILGLVSQIFNRDFIRFLVSLFHIFGLVFVLYVMYVFFYKYLHSMQNVRSSMDISSDICTEEELEWLKMLAEGKKYSHISRKFDVSESKVKQRVLELYKVLGVNNKTEFITMYHQCDFTYKKN